MKFVAVLVMLMATSPMIAGSCRPYYRTYYPTHTYYEPSIKVVDAIEYLRPVLPIYTIPPSYGAFYIPGTQPPQAPPQAPTDPCGDLRIKLAQLEVQMQTLLRGGPPQSPPERSLPGGPTEGQRKIEELKKTLAQLQELERQQSLPKPQPMPPASNGTDFLAFTKDNCASCHDKSTSELKGGKFTMIDNGKLVEFTPQQAGSIILRLSVGDGHEQAMPKGRKMDAATRLKGVQLFAQ